jgi:hypothetical protein
MTSNLAVKPTVIAFSVAKDGSRLQFSLGNASRWCTRKSWCSRLVRARRSLIPLTEQAVQREETYGRHAAMAVTVYRSQI